MALINISIFFLLLGFLQVKSSGSLIYLILIFLCPQFIAVYIKFISFQLKIQMWAWSSLIMRMSPQKLKYNISLHKCALFLIFFEFLSSLFLIFFNQIFIFIQFVYDFGYQCVSVRKLCSQNKCHIRHFSILVN